jgi:hypothetical protein
MGRPKVNVAKLKEIDSSRFLEFENEVLEAIAREERERRQEKLEAQSGKKRSRRRNK